MCNVAKFEKREKFRAAVEKMLKKYDVYMFIGKSAHVGGMTKTQVDAMLCLSVASQLGQVISSIRS